MKKLYSNGLAEEAEREQKKQTANFQRFFFQTVQGRKLQWFFGVAKAKKWNINSFWRVPPKFFKERVVRCYHCYVCVHDVCIVLPKDKKKP